MEAFLPVPARARGSRGIFLYFIIGLVVFTVVTAIVIIALGIIGINIELIVGLIRNKNSSASPMVAADDQYDFAGGSNAISGNNPNGGFLTVGGGTSSSSQSLGTGKLRNDNTALAGNLHFDALTVDGRIEAMSASSYFNDGQGVGMMLNGGHFQVTRGSAFVAGSVQATGFNQPSDLSTKDNVTNLDPMICATIVSGLNPVLFSYKPEFAADTSLRFGFIAQEVEAVCPLLVKESKYIEADGSSPDESRKLLTLDTMQMIPILIGNQKALTQQLLQAFEQIESLRQQLIALRSDRTTARATDAQPKQSPLQQQQEQQQEQQQQQQQQIARARAATTVPLVQGSDLQSLQKQSQTTEPSLYPEHPALAKARVAPRTESQPSREQSKLPHFESSPLLAAKTRTSPRDEHEAYSRLTGRAEAQPQLEIGVARAA